MFDDLILYKEKIPVARKQDRWALFLLLPNAYYGTYLSKPEWVYLGENQPWKSNETTRSIAFSKLPLNMRQSIIELLLTREP